MTTLLIINAVFMFLTVASVYVVAYLAHRLPDSAPADDRTWGFSGNPVVPSEPLPFKQVDEHETERELARAA